MSQFNEMCGKPRRQRRSVVKNRADATGEREGKSALLYRVAFVIAVWFLPFADGAAAFDGFFTESPDGWHWYVDPVWLLEPDPEEEEPPTPPPVVHLAPPEVAEAQEAVIAPPAAPLGPAAFSAEWLREAIPKYRDKAYDNPTEENVAAFFYLQRYAMDRAQQFAETAQRVVLADANLDGNTRRPIASFAAQGVDESAREATEEVARAITAVAGVWYFYRSDCPYCKEQNVVLQRLTRRLGMRVLPIALDGKAMPDGAFPRFVPDVGQAEALEVQVTPTLFMVRPPDTFVPLGSGVLTDSDILRRIVDGAHAAKWISDEEHQRTKAVAPTRMAAGPDPSITDFEDPRDLILALRARIKHGSSDTPLGLLQGLTGPPAPGSSAANPAAVLRQMMSQ